MSGRRRFLPNKAVVFITTRTIEGLPLVASDLLNNMLEGIIARASEASNVDVCHYTVMANHPHFVLVGEQTNDIPEFMRYFKTESSHTVNRLLGRINRPIWEADYECQLLLTAQDVVEKACYIYNNPGKADLVDSIEEFPGVSSWKLFTGKTRQKTVKRTFRSSITPLPSPALTIAAQRRLAADYAQRKAEETTLVLKPDSWMKCFPEMKRICPKKTNAKIKAFVKGMDEEYAKKRRRKNKLPLGATALKRASMLAEHTPKKSGTQKVCSSKCPVVKQAFLELYYRLCKEAKEIYQEWKLGDFRRKMPPGILSPKPPPLCSALPLPL